MTDIRTLRRDDLDSLMRLKDSAGWNQTREDWLDLLSAEPEGCFGIQQHGQIAATTTALRHGNDLAWIGMVLTDPAYRGRGFARALMERALAWLRDEGVRWAKLDATAMGEGLYRSLGFDVECAIERWRREPGELACSGADGILQFGGFSPIDDVAFGVSRGKHLAQRQRGESAQTASGAYAMGRRGSQCWYFGPCVSALPSDADKLTSWFIARHAHEPVFWDLLPGNEAAVNLARKLGFAPVRQLKRMSLRLAGGPEIAGRPEWIYAISGFEAG